MSKQTFLIFATLLLLQNYGHADILNSWGGKVGVALAKHDFEGFIFIENDDTQRRTGIAGALFAEWQLRSPIALITQIEYLQKGVGFKVRLTDELNNPAGIKIINSRLDYLSFQLFTKFTFSINKISLYPLLGFRYDQLIKKSDFLEDIYQDFRNQVWGASIGLGIRHSMSSLFDVLVEARYDIDFSDSYKPENFSVKNNSINISLGVGF